MKMLVYACMETSKLITQDKINTALHIFLLTLADPEEKLGDEVLIFW